MNPYIVYDLDAWPVYPTDNFKLTKLIFWWGYGVAFDGAGLWLS